MVVSASADDCAPVDSYTRDSEVVCHASNGSAMPSDDNDNQILKGNLHYRSNGHSPATAECRASALCVGNDHAHSSADVKSVGDQAAGTSVPHPFLYELHATCMDRVIFLLMLVFVAPVRLVLVIASLVLAWIFGSIALLGLPIVCDEPLCSWRKIFKAVAVFFVRALWFFAGMQYVTVKGRRVSSSVAPILVMAPHSSHIDTLTGTLCGFPGVVSVIENGRLPLVGKLFRLSESVFVSRLDPDSRQKAVREIQRRAHSGGKWSQVVVFPEGTCTNRKSLLPFKTGAFMPGVPIQPMCVRYPGRLDLASWINVGPSLLTMFFLHMSYPHTPLEMEFLPVYYPSEEEKNNAQLYADNVRKLFSKHMGLPLTHHTYEDLIELQKRCASSRPSIFTVFKDLFLQGSIAIPKHLIKEK